MRVANLNKKQGHIMAFWTILSILLQYAEITITKQNVD